MRLIHCHIENFGCLHDFDYDFNAGLNVIYHDNGWGKSTLASFIRVMFYGFENETKRAVGDRERAQKDPWQKGTYGGSITFEVNGKTYRMIRTFDHRKASEDTFELYDAATNLPSVDYGNDIGEELFDIDADSFCRTVFIAQQDCASYATDQINAKIGNISRETADMGNYEQAAAALSAEMNRITERRVTGLGRKLKDQIEELKTQIVRKPYLNESLAAMRRQLNDLQLECAGYEKQETELNERIDRSAKAATYQADLKIHQSLVNDLKQASVALQESRSWFPGEIPSEQEADRMIALTRKYEADQARKESLAFTSKESLTLDQFQKVFAQGIPDEDTISLISSNVVEYELLKEEVSENRLSESEMKRLKEDRVMFEGKQCSPDLISSMIDKWQKYEKEQTVFQTKREGEEKKTKMAGRLIIAGAVLVLVGVTLCLCHQTLLGVGIGLISVIILLVAMNTGTPKKILEETQQKLDGRRDEVYAFVDAFEGNHEQVLAQLYDIRNRYEGWINREQRYQESLCDEKTERQDKLARRLDDFFFPYYGETQNYSARLEKLQNDIREYDALQEKADRYEQACRDVRADGYEYRRFCSEFGFAAGSDMHAHMEEIRDHIRACADDQKSYLEKKHALDVFESEHDLSESVDAENAEDLESLHEQLRAVQMQSHKCMEQIRSIERNVEQNEQEVGHLEQLESERDEKQAQYEELKVRYDVLDQTFQKLTEARNQFNARYLKPIQASFDRYYTVLSGEKSDRYELDAGLNITLRAYGRGRNIQSLSEGYQDLIGMCRRMAMIDAMYEKEKPFLVLDDPFVNLDDQKLTCAGKFVNEIAGEHQVIYLTCHSGRKLES
ncbi:MAG: AAA family ATPase [Bulleidia sp.]